MKKMLLIVLVLLTSIPFITFASDELTAVKETLKQLKDLVPVAGQIADDGVYLGHGYAECSHWILVRQRQPKYYLAGTKFGLNTKAKQLRSLAEAQSSQRKAKAKS